MLMRCGSAVVSAPCTLSTTFVAAAVAMFMSLPRETKSTAFVLGAATFFLPCGFTQALQVYVLSQASFAAGALTMLAFALGTLPAMLSLSAIASLARGGFQKHFLRFAGAAVILLGLMNIRYGLVLTATTAMPTFIGCSSSVARGTSDFPSSASASCSSSGPIRSAAARTSRPSRSPTSTSSRSAPPTSGR
jgi:sulfite exporter TauE/SafE